MQYHPHDYQTYAPLSWNICGGADPQETYESMKNELQATIDEAMNK